MFQTTLAGAPERPVYEYQTIDAGERNAAPFSNWTDKRHNAGSHGANLLRNIIGEQNPFSYPKSVHTVEDAILSAEGMPGESLVLDFFAGSGTTGHAVLSLNREDGGARRCILVEMGAYVDSVLKPRIKKVVFSADWKDGKPVLPKNGKSAGLSHAFKYIRVESYEDALGNIAFEVAQGGLKFDRFIFET